MDPNEPIDRARTALLLMDFQSRIVAGAGDPAAVLRQAGAAAEAARAAGLTVIYVTIGFRPGYPEVSPRNAAFGTLKASGFYASGDPKAEIHPDLAPGPGDITVAKRRVSAFSGSDLEVILRAKGIGTLVLAGIATSGVVLSTVRQAADADYGLIVLSDCCADRDPEVHRCLVEKVFPRQARVITAQEFRRALGAP